MRRVSWCGRNFVLVCYSVFATFLRHLRKTAVDIRENGLDKKLVEAFRPSRPLREARDASFTHSRLILRTDLFRKSPFLADYYPASGYLLYAVKPPTCHMSCIYHIHPSLRETRCRFKEIDTGFLRISSSRNGIRLHKI